MARRGAELREHILWSAKDVFLESGYERTSMDVVSARAETSKRSLYAHFENKEKLFLAVIELVRERFLNRMRQPADYSSKPAEALVQFCARYVEILTYESSIQMMRVSAAESERFPDQAALYFDVMFTQIQFRLNGYLRETFGLSVSSASEASNRLMVQIIHPRLVRAMFGVDTLAKTFGEEGLSPGFDLKPIRKAVNEMLRSVEPKGT